MKLQRPLQCDGDKFLDDETKEYITLDTALKEYLSQVPQAIEEFSRLSRKPETTTEELGMRDLQPSQRTDESAEARSHPHPFGSAQGRPNPLPSRERGLAHAILSGQ